MSAENRIEQQEMDAAEFVDELSDDALDRPRSAVRSFAWEYAAANEADVVSTIRRKAMTERIEQQEKPAAEIDELSDEALDRAPERGSPFCTFFSSGSGGWVRPRAPKEKS